MDLVYVWYDDRHWSKILLSTIPTPVWPEGQGHRLGTFMLKFYVLSF